MKNLDKIQWLFLRDNNFKAIHTIKELLKVEKIPPSTIFMNNKSLLMISLCRITMRRVALLTNVNKVHHKIDTFLNRPSIYIYKLEFFLNELSGKAQ
jgi:hypothetical protein